ncbi:DUF4129 domain-containing protein [Streptomyces sp. NPDC000349]|uniref:DUF4129 domain-containing protein n=1 Tax=unclassified Streptomyces TaxID=2593676 RepID=UPI00278500AB|nr:DUF4129 domain-containing protein [Streptomyces sp. DSM 40167]MDQ0401619.1 hypothetical protein [Streptomyces sp. DSM 40167]
MEHGEHGRRRAVPGAVVAAGVVGALAVAALVLRPAEGLLHSGQGPLGHWGIVAIGSSVAWAAGVMLVVERLRSRIAADRDPLTPGEERLRRAAVPLLLAGPGVIGVLALVMHRFNRRSTSPTPPVELPPPVSPPPVLGRADPEGGSGHGSSVPLYVLLGLLASVVAVVAVVLVVRRLRRRGLTVPALPERAGAPAGDEDARLLLAAVHSGRRALADTGDARAAVIACYAAMEDALVASGLRRHASDSPADLLTRASDAGLAPGPAAPRLTTLFREARYSSHPMGPSHREAAADALEEIASLLQHGEAQR